MRPTVVSMRLRMAALCGALVAGLLGGCGGDDGAPSGSTDRAASPAPGSATPAVSGTASTEPPPRDGAPTGSQAAPPPADATLVIFLPLGTAASGAAQVEITDPTKLDTLPVSAAQLDRVRTAVQPFQRRGLRLFAFVRDGCQNTGAVLSITQDGMLVVLTGGEETRCFAAEYFLAVFAVPSGKVPPGTRP